MAKKLPDEGIDPRGLEGIVPVQQGPLAESRGFLEIIGQMPTRIRALTILAMLGVGGACLEACFSGSDVDTGSDPVLLSGKEGDADFKMYRAGKATVTDEFGKTLYHFIKGHLSKDPIFNGMSQPDQLNLINVIIHFCETLNEEDLDAFKHIDGKTLYFPDVIYISKPDGVHLLDLAFVEPDSKKNKELAKQVDKEEPGLHVVNGQLDHMLESLAQEYARSNGEDVSAQMQAFDRLMTRTSTGNYHVILKEYNLAGKAEMRPYGEKKASEIQDEIESLRGDSGTSIDEGTKRDITKLKRILKTKMYEEFVEILKKLKPSQVEEQRILRGTVLDTSVPFYNLKKLWQHKKTKKGKKSDEATYNIVINQLADKSNTVTLASWLENQKLACGYFQKHGAKLGYNEELAKYMTPAVVLAVMHAEFFSELSGEAYLDLLPVAIESGNLPYGPSMGDKEFSTGEVQLLRPTLERFLNGNGEKLRNMQAVDPSFTFLAPQKRQFEIKKGKKTTTVTRYDDEEIVNAMITHLPSHAFYTVLAIADHIELGFNELIQDLGFKKAWDNASEKEKYLFMASFSASAINNGRGSEKHNNGAYAVGPILLKRVEKGSSLAAYTAGIPEAAKESVSPLKPGKRTTVSRGANKGFEAMHEMLRRIKNLPEVPQSTPVSPEPTEEIIEKPRTAISTSYQPLLDRAAEDGFRFSSNPAENKPIYDAAKRRGVKVPADGEGYRLKSNTSMEAVMDADALVVLRDFAREFKKRSGGYSLVITDLLRSPEQQDAISISKGTHPGGRTMDIADGRFINTSGKEITWSEKGGRGPHADEIEKILRPVMIQLIEEYQASGLILGFDETERGAKARHPEQKNPRSGGHWHVYITKQ